MAVIAHNRPLNDSPSILNVAVSHFLSVMNECRSFSDTVFFFFRRGGD